jgi:hypothetical protein
LPRFFFIIFAFTSADSFRRRDWPLITLTPFHYFTAFAADFFDISRYSPPFSPPSCGAAMAAADAIAGCFFDIYFIGFSLLSADSHFSSASIISFRCYHITPPIRFADYYHVISIFQHYRQRHMPRHYDIITPDISCHIFIIAAG